MQEGEGEGSLGPEGPGRSGGLGGGPWDSSWAREPGSREVGAWFPNTDGTVLPPGASAGKGKRETMSGETRTWLSPEDVGGVKEARDRAPTCHRRDTSPHPWASVRASTENSGADGREQAVGPRDSPFEMSP